ncbi:MAG: alanine racemase, partial [Erysipelotrichaceae bacterium]
QLPGLKVEGVFSHFSVSDDLHAEHLAYTQKQIALYDEVLALLAQAGIPKQITHLQNTYGILNYPHLPYDYVRPGLLHLGLTSHKDLAVNHPLDLQPIMECKAQITLVKTIHSGSSVSYGRNFVAHHDMQVATVSIGYGDGYPRILSNTNTQVLVHGVLCPVIGNVCMDQIVIDVSKVACAVEDVVTLFGVDEGVELPIDQISHKAQTINNDTLCMLNARLPRTYKR